MSEGRQPPWDVSEELVKYGIDAVIALLAEFNRRRNGVHRLAAYFKEKSRAILQRLARSSSAAARKAIREEQVLEAERSVEDEIGLFDSLLEYFGDELGSCNAIVL